MYNCNKKVVKFIWTKMLREIKRSSFFCLWYIIQRQINNPNILVTIQKIDRRKTNSLEAFFAQFKSFYKAYYNHCFSLPWQHAYMQTKWSHVSYTQTWSWTNSFCIDLNLQIRSKHISNNHYIQRLRNLFYTCSPKVS